MHKLHQRSLPLDLKTCCNCIKIDPSGEEILYPVPRIVVTNTYNRKSRSILTLAEKKMLKVNIVLLFSILMMFD